MRTLGRLPFSPRHHHFAISLLVLILSANLASAGEPVNGKALLIGIQEYAKAPRLSGVKNDVRTLANTLVERGAYTVETVVNSAKRDDGALFGQRSERESLQQTIAQWLAGRKQDETALLYFSGHGFRDEQNRLYLAAVDCDPTNPEPGGIPIAWLRERLVQCAAGLTLLVLDACHAGSARSAQPKNIVRAKELTDFFESTKGLVTLASCTGEQKSCMWPKKKQSLFTYWFAQGLCGHADREPLGEITLNELDDFLAKKVRRSALKIFSMDQTPTRLQGPGVTKNTVMRLRPGSLKQLLDDMAEALDVLIRLADIERVGIVPEFTSGTSGQVLGREFGALATNCPVELADRLAAKSGGDYRVVSINAVREVLQAEGIAPKDIGTSKCRGISIEDNRLPALIAGRVESLRARTMALQCKLIDTASGDIHGIAGGTARLCGSESAMQGVSGRAQPVVEPGEPSPSPQLQPARIDAVAGHPLGDQSFPYQAQIMVRDNDGKLRERKGTFSGNDCHVTLRRGEIFRVYVANRSQKPAFVRVLVDGLNTLPEKSQTKGFYVEPKLVDRWRQAQPVNLIEARAWGPLEPGQEYSIRGFYLRTGTNAVYNEFKVVDAAQSLASEAGYTDQLGLITVAFYDPKKKPPPPPPGQRRGGVGRGGRYHTQTDTYTGPYEPGRLVAVVHIRYGE